MVAEEPRAPKLAWVEKGQALLGARAQRRVQVPWEGGAPAFCADLCPGEEPGGQRRPQPGPEGVCPASPGGLLIIEVGP